MRFIWMLESKDFLVLNKKKVDEKKKVENMLQSKGQALLFLADPQKMKFIFKVSCLEGVRMAEWSKAPDS